MNSPLFKVNMRDVVNGFVVAVLSGVLDWLIQIIEVPGFSIYHFDWKMLVNVAVIAGLGYIGKKFLSTPDGKFGGVI